MTLRDRDLVSIQEARELVARAGAAQKKFAAFSQEQVDTVVEACAKAAVLAAEPLARLAVEETTYGNVPDKIIKNTLAGEFVHRAIRDMKTVGILRHNPEEGIVEVATPVGVVAAIIPTTNPTSTAIYKTLISIKARNAVVCSPHPNATRCIRETVQVMARAADTAGAPAGLISCLSEPTMQGTQELMRLRDVGVILATGGAALVRQAYSSGRPAYGVGPGNVPAYVERTANVRKAVADIIAGKTFDYGTICSSEQAIVVDEAVSEQVLEECRRNDAYFLSPEETKTLGALVFDPVRHVPNAKIVGQPATRLAAMAGIKVPAATRVLISRLEPNQVGRDFPLSAEKLSPILAFYVVKNTAEAIDLCRRLLHFGGAGHTASVHTQNEAVAREYGAGVPAFRVCVNTASVHGSIGYSTNLFPAMTLGCGSPGGNITSDNIGPQHLMNVKRIAWESRPIDHRTIPEALRSAPLSGALVSPAAVAPAKAVAAAAGAAASPPPAGGTVAPPRMVASSDAPDRALIASIVENVFTARGIPRGRSDAAAPKQTPPPAPAPEAKLAPAPASAVPAAPEVAAPAQPSPPAKPQAVPFVSENDVRVAITRGQKILVGPKTIITPSARDLASDHEGILIETK
jgi:acetaldehyde dehydrogenase (acetylating)